MNKLCCLFVSFLLVSCGSGLCNATCHDPPQDITINNSPPDRLQRQQQVPPYQPGIPRPSRPTQCVPSISMPRSYTTVRMLPQIRQRVEYDQVEEEYDVQITEYVPQTRTEKRTRIRQIPRIVQDTVECPVETRMIPEVRWIPEITWREEMPAIQMNVCDVVRGSTLVPFSVAPVVQQCPPVVYCDPAIAVSSAPVVLCADRSNPLARVPGQPVRNIVRCLARRRLGGRSTCVVEGTRQGSRVPVYSRSSSDWTWPGNTYSSLQSHGTGWPHNWDQATIQNSSYRQLVDMHNACHERIGPVSGRQLAMMNR